MATVTIPNVDYSLRERLVERAARHGHSIEVAAREILEDALVGKQPAAAPDNLYDAIRKIVELLGGIELEPFPRQSVRKPPMFD
jgi:plasmid stability protein